MAMGLTTMGLFNLFGGKKKDEAKAAPVVAAAPKAEPKAEKVKAEAPKAEAKAEKAKTATPVAVAVSSNAGSAQVKLRLKLAASLRTKQHAQAYEAAKSLADIQAKAGRRLGARLWAEQADRIKAQDPKAA
jgi:hypothetical protein